MVKMADEMLEDEDSEVKNFFEHVIAKTEEILSQNSFARSERHISEVTYECHNEFGHGTKYTLRDTKAPHLKAVFLGSTLFRLSLIRLLCTVYPIARKCPRS